VGNSLRFRASASAYLSRTPAVDGSRTTWTWSSWVKRGTLGTGQTIFGRDQNGSGQAFAQLNFNSSDQLNFINYSTTTDNVKTSNAVYRDPAAWYHIVCVFNSGNATASDRIQLYVNGQRITSFSSSTDPSLNYSGYINQAGLQHDIGSILVSSRINYVDGYLTEINFIDGQALTPNSFGTVNAYGVWQPITYGGSYGTNGFYLPFTNTTSTTTLGYDFSPNGNNWTTNNISLTAGVTYDSMTDVPTLTSATASNFCVVSPFQLSASGALFTLSYGNLNYSCGASAGNAGRMLAVGTMALPTGKTYWEIKATNTNGLPGISDGAYAADNASGPYKYIGVYNAGQSLNNTTATYTGTTFTYTTNDMIGFAFDGTAMTLACYKNGSLIGTFSAIDSTVTWLPFVGVATGSSSTSCEFNFGQRPFSYTPPSGFVALNTYNL
jgi:hypothetical protein